MFVNQKLKVETRLCQTFEKFKRVIIEKSAEQLRNHSKYLKEKKDKT